MNKKNETLLVVKGLKKSFHTKQGVFKAINEISFTIKPGEIMGLIGESGSGKTTVGRLLIRLYGDFSGYVSLDNKIISGKYISKKTNLFLHKNMQMIFQDPHASLNGQQNVYSILKEPLIVNNIMKNEYEDIFKDWQTIINHFKYSFRKKAKKIEYSNIESLNKETESFIKEWKDELLNLKFDFNKDKIDNLFNSYFGFLDSRQLNESYHIKTVFVNNEELFNSYYHFQKKYRNDELPEDEKKLKNSKEKLDLTLTLSAYSLKTYLVKKEKDILKAQINIEKKQVNEDILNIKNMLYSYLLEYKNIYLFFDEEANKITSYIEFNKLKKQSLIYKKIYKTLNKEAYKLSYLNFNDVDRLINLLNIGAKNLLVVLQEVKEYDKNYLSKIKKLINSEFNFRILTFLNISADNKKTIDNSFTQQKILLDEKTKILKLETKPHKSNIDILFAEKEYQNNFDEFKWNLKIHLQKFKNEMKLLDENIESKKIINTNFRVDLEILNSEFDQTHKRFINEFKKYAHENSWLEEKIKEKTNFFNNKVVEKKDSLKSFEIEVQNLKNDFQKILHLVGVVKNKFSKIFVKKILLKEKIYASLEEVGLLRQFAWRYPHEFSGGQRQRIVIARALISKPKLIIADEPIASLDISIQAQIVNLLKNLCKTKNVALIFIAHDLSMVEYIADTINIMHLGKIVESGNTSQIYSKPIHPYTINLFNSIPKISNANKPFVASNFEINYLVEQQESLEPVEEFKCGENHYIYANKKQYIKWMGLKEKSIKLNDNNSVWKDGSKLNETIIIDV